MKRTVFLLAFFMVFVSTEGLCQKNRERNRLKADTVGVDSLEHRLVVLDPGFDAWLATKPSKEFYSKEYYEQRNRLYTNEWNQRYLSMGKTGLYETYIDYNPNIDYGLDINYKLYYYFRYFEETNRVKLIPSVR